MRECIRIISLCLGLYTLSTPGFSQDIALSKELDRVDCYRLSHLNWQIGSLFDSLNLKDQAKKYYRDGLMTWKRSRMSLRCYSAHSLCRIYVSENKYDSVIFYLRSKFSISDLEAEIGFDWSYRDNDLYYQLMLAYERLGMIDSAIQCFTPFAFMGWTNSEGTAYSTQHIYKDDYHCQVQDFLRILHLKYDACYINEQILNLVNRAEFVIFHDPEKNKDEYRLQFYIHFLGKRFKTVSEACLYPHQVGNEDDENLSSFKLSNLEELRHALLYMQSFNSGL